MSNFQDNTSIQVVHSHTIHLTRTTKPYQGRIDRRLTSTKPLKHHKGGFTPEVEKRNPHSPTFHSPKPQSHAMQIPTQKNPTIAATSQTWNKIDKPVQKCTSTTNQIENSLELLLTQSFPRWCHKDPLIKASARNPKTRRRESIQRRK